MPHSRTIIFKTFETKGNNNYGSPLPTKPPYSNFTTPLPTKPPTSNFTMKRQQHANKQQNTLQANQ